MECKIEEADNSENLLNIINTQLSLGWKLVSVTVYTKCCSGLYKSSGLHCMVC